MATFTIPGRLPSLNVQFKVGVYRFTQSKNRQKVKDYIASWILASHVPFFKTQVQVTFRWIEPNRMRDYDNIEAGTKLIMDALVMMDRIPGDSQRWARPPIHIHDIDKKNPRIEVTIEGYEDVKKPKLFVA